MSRPGPFRLRSLPCALGAAIAVAPLIAAGAEPAASNAAKAPMPTDRAPIVLETGERNPFAQRAAPKQDLITGEIETEETTLRGLLMKFPISGATAESERPARMLLGTMTLEEGREIPSLMPGQRERIRVLKIGPREILFGFVEENGSAETRTFIRNYSLAPTVRYLLPSKAPMAETSPAASALEGVVSNEKAR